MTTLADIAREYGVTPQAVGKWRDSAISKYGDLPYEQVGKRKQYTSHSVAKIIEFAPSQPITTEVVNGELIPVDSLAGYQGSNGIVPLQPQALNRTNAIEQAQDRVNQICQASQATNQQSFEQLLENGNQTGLALGTFLGEQIIQAAETQKSQMLKQYMAAQGVATDPKPSDRNPVV